MVFYKGEQSVEYKIVSDSSSNVIEMGKVNYKAVPLKIICGDKEYVDTPELDIDNMIEELKKTKNTSGTSCPNVYDWLEAYEGEKNIFAFSISSSLSGSYTSAVCAKEKYIETNPTANICVIDTLSTGPEMRLLMEKVEECADSGFSFEEIENKIKDYQENTHVIFCVKSMNNLAKNGRIPMAFAKIALVLGIHVVGQGSDKGTLEPLHKCRGEQKSINTIYDVMLSNGFSGGKVRISHCQNVESAKKLEKIIKSNYPKCDVFIEKCTALCSFYAEQGGLIIGYEG